VGNDQRSEYRGVLQFIEILSRDRDRYVGFFFFRVSHGRHQSVTGDGFCNVGSRVSPGEYFNGAISAVYMFNRVLSDADINNIYTNTLRWF
jgi:hypothetical protein